MGSPPSKGPDGESAGAAKNPVRDLFNLAKNSYSNFFLDRRSGANFGFRKRLDLVQDMSRGSSGALLECACGTGEITEAVLRSGHFERAVIVDISNEMLECARERIVTGCTAGFVDLEFIAEDIFSYCARGTAHKFDVILCLGLIAHTGKLKELLLLLRQLLVPGGQLLLQSTVLDHAGVRFVRRLTSERYYRRFGYRITYYTTRDIVAAASVAGLQVMALRRYMLGLPFGDRICPWANFYLESFLEKWAERHGMEALYAMGHDEDRFRNGINFT
jgi:2-polyprenyl-3-methyl-5-hydroxy-6-metoxy-1,4-benzoquinol methylase